MHEKSSIDKYSSFFSPTMRVSSSSRWSSYLDSFSPSSIVPLMSRPFLHKDAPQIVNMVSTVLILRQGEGYKLPLESISRVLSTCSQFTPSQFAANIVKISDCISACTSLIFRSGSIVVVSAATENHVRYVCQKFRRIIEQIECIMTEDSSAPPRVSTLSGRTIFKQCSICNIVGHSDLGMTIDLEALRDAAPEDCKYRPDNFPGLKCHIWLTESQECACNAAVKLEDDAQKVLKKQAKCSCSVKCLVFKTGRIVVIGGRSISDINSVFYRIKKIAPKYKEGTIPKNCNFYNAFASIMIKKKTEKNPDEAVSSLLHQVHDMEPVVKNGKKRARLYPAHVPVPEKVYVMSSLCPLIKFADAGRVEEVRVTLALDPKQVEERDSDGKNALDRLKSIPPDRRTKNHEEIIKLLSL